MAIDVEKSDESGCPRDRLSFAGRVKSLQKGRVEVEVGVVLKGSELRLAVCAMFISLLNLSVNVCS